jgi:hypothetical protein
MNDDFINSDEFDNNYISSILVRIDHLITGAKNPKYNLNF